MDTKEFEFILSQGEGTFVEFKESLDTKSLAREIVALANTQGGKIILGVSDDCKIKGFKVTNENKAQIQDIAHHCDPSIKVHLEKFDNVLIIHVAEGEDKPYGCSQGFFVRVGAQSQKLTRDEIFDFAVSEGKIRWDEQINKDFDFEKDFDESKLNQYLKLAGLTKNIPIKEILINLRVAQYVGTEFKFNNAGVLFFAKEPGKFFINSKVVCCLLQNNNKTYILDKKILDNGIISNIIDAQNYIDRHNDTEFIIKELARKEIPQFPKDAYREAIVNAVMHCDYFQRSGDIMVEVYRNKVIVSNPGGLVKWLPKKDFGTMSRPRNLLIAELLSKTDYVERIGSGINRIKDAMYLAGLAPPIFDYDMSFVVTINDKTGGVGKGESSDIGSEKSSDIGSDKSSDKILAILKEQPAISAKTLGEKLNISSRAVEKQLSKLKEHGFIKRIGSKKGGHWEIMK
jgi:ATP-dependent DNA helicase RecG